MLALFLRYSCVILALFLRYSCVILALFLRYSAAILALFCCYYGFILLVIPTAPPPSAIAVVSHRRGGARCVSCGLLLALARLRAPGAHGSTVHHRPHENNIVDFGFCYMHLVVARCTPFPNGVLENQRSTPLNEEG